MSNDFNPLRFEFQDCNEFLAGLDHDEQSSSSSLYTPSPQEILGNSFADEYGTGQSNQVTGNEWNIDRMFEFTGGDYDNSNNQAVSAGAASATASADFAGTNSTDFNSLDFGIDNGDSSAFSSPNSVINSSSSTSSDVETIGNQYSKPAVQNGMPSYPITPPYLQGTNISSASSVSGNQAGSPSIKIERRNSPPLDIKTEKPTTIKRTSTGSVNTKNGKISKPRKEKTSHNMIEKRYRTNINDKILALRDCVPSLRCVVSGKGDEDLEGLTPASKLNKATVLTKATEYIIHLQSRNNALVQELEDLRNAVKASGNASQVTSSSNHGMVPSYQNGYSFDAYPPQPNSSSNAASKVMMCSMAGLMASGMMGGADDSSTRGLSGIPIFSAFAGFKYGPIDFARIMFGIKLSLILGTLVYILSPVFFAATSSNSGKQRQQSFSPVHLRKQAWLASSQYLRVPSVGDVFGTIFSLLATSTEVIVSVLLGFDGYKMVRTIFSGNNSFDSYSSDNLVRAIDCQLCGGDDECNDTRVLSTFLQGFLAQPSATRYMLQSLQAKVFSLGAPAPLRRVADYMCQYMWTLAQKCASKSTSDLPPHLIELVSRPDAFSERDNIQRLRNLAMGMPSAYGCVYQQADSGVETVGLDSGVVSSLDAYASWYAFRHVQSVLSEYLTSNCVFSKELQDRLEIAGKVSPPNTNAQRRVAIVKALLYGPEQPEYTVEAMECIKRNIENAKTEKSIRPFEEETESISSFSDSDESQISDDTTVEEGISAPVTTFKKENPTIVTIDSRVALHCSFILQYLGRGDYEHGLQLAQNLRIDPNAQIGLLSFVALYKMLKGVRDSKEDVSTLGKLESLAAVARLWVGSEDAETAGLSLEKRRELVGETVEFSILFGGFEVEQGA